jgi:hypothetical protein
MPTVRQITTRALRFLGVVSEGQPAPSAYDSELAREALQSLYTQLIASGAFGDLTDVDIEDDYEAGENERVVNVSDGDVSVTMPALIETTDPDTGATTERLPYDRSVVIVARQGTYMYDADEGDWLQVDALELTDTAPLSGRYGTGLAALLAVSLAPDYGAEPGSALTALANEGSQQLYQKRLLTASLDPGLTARAIY